MKSLLLTAALIGLSFSAAQAADPTAKTPAAPATTPPAAPAAPKKDAKTDEKAPKAQGWNHKIDSIDATAKTLTFTVTKGAKEVNTVTDKTVIMQGDKPATFAEIKEGDVVSGSRIKTGENTYDIVKITKFAAPAAKEDKPAEKKTTDTPKKK